MDIRPIYLVKIVHRDSYNLWYCDASGVGAGGVWVYPNEDRVNRIWQVQWPEYTKAELTSFKNIKRETTNSDLGMAALVLKESVFPQIIRELAWRTPTLGRYNTTTVARDFREVTNINPFVANLLSIRSYHNRHHRIVP